MEWSIIWNNLDFYIQGLFVTLQLLFLSVFSGFFISIFFAFLKKSKIKIVCYLINFFGYSFRGTPLLVQLYVIYYGLGQFEFLKSTIFWHLLESPYFCAFISLALNNIAYTQEIFYNGLLAVNKDQIEAAKAFGMSIWQQNRLIIIPNALRISFPAYGNEIILMLHSTSLVSLITVLDITGTTRLIYSRFYSPFEAFAFAGLLYLLITYTIVFAFKLIEKKIYKSINIQ